MSRVVVTGGSGKLGAVVINDLIAHGYDVVNVDVAPPATPTCPFIRADLTDFGQAFEAVHGIDSRPEGLEALVHLAVPGLTPSLAMFRQNMLLTHNVFIAATRERDAAIVSTATMVASVRGQPCAPVPMSGNAIDRTPSSSAMSSARR